MAMAVRPMIEPSWNSQQPTAPVPAITSDDANSTTWKVISLLNFKSVVGNIALCLLTWKRA
jgi:hypothetical protein